METYREPVMIRLATVALLAASAVVPSVASAAPTGYYIAVPAAPATQPNLMTHTTPWRLQDGAYVAAQAPERHQLLCQLVAQRVGTLASFTVRGKAYDADALAKCNARVKAS